MKVLKMFKDYLKYILPPPTKSFMREVNSLKSETATVMNEISKVSERVERAYQAIPNKTIYWKNPFEYKIVSANWGKVTEESDFKEKYLRLISGLERDDIKILTRILTRQTKYLATECREMDLFTREEQEKIRLLEESFKRDIFKVADDLYAYNGYLLPVDHFESSVFYYKHGIDELKTADKVKGKTILDVGGFIGDSVLVFEDLEPKTIYTFEADPNNYALLLETIKLNKITNAVPVQLALGDHIGSCFFHEGGSGSGTYYREGIPYKEDIMVPMTTLDAFVEEHPMEIGLIKVDIEGGEPLFLEGARKTISEQKPVLLVSIYHNAHDFFELKPMIESWDLGYRFHVHKPVYENTTSETLLICEI